VKTKLTNAYMETAESFANCSTAKRLKVGAIVVDPKTGAIISVGYNGTLPGEDNCCEEHDAQGNIMWTKEEVLHAEENAIAKLARSNCSAEGALMFVTHSPCVKCARMIVASGIKKVYYGEKFTGHIESGIPLLERNKVITHHVDPEWTLRGTRGQKSG